MKCSFDNCCVGTACGRTSVLMSAGLHRAQRRIDDGQKFRITARKAIGDETLCLEILTLLKAKTKDGITKSKTVIGWDQLAGQV